MAYPADHARRLPHRDPLRPGQRAQRCHPAAIARLPGASIVTCKASPSKALDVVNPPAKRSPIPAAVTRRMRPVSPMYSVGGFVRTSASVAGSLSKTAWRPLTYATGVAGVALPVTLGLLDAVGGLGVVVGGVVLQAASAQTATARATPSERWRVRATSSGMAPRRTAAGGPWPIWARPIRSGPRPSMACFRPSGPPTEGSRLHNE